MVNEKNIVYVPAASIGFFLCIPLTFSLNIARVWLTESRYENWLFLGIFCPILLVQGTVVFLNELGIDGVDTVVYGAWNLVCYGVWI